MHPHDLFAVQLAYSKNNNYKILINEFCKSAEALVIFSSNAIYYPNDEFTAHKIITKNDRYEFRSIKFSAYKKVIYVRDVFKCWYLYGISKELNSRSSLLNFLENELSEFNVTTMGISAGGYAATYFGLKLKAKNILSFSSQIDLKIELNSVSAKTSNPLVMKYGDEVGWEDLNLINIILESEEVYKDRNINIVFIYPRGSVGDVKHMELVKSISVKNIRLSLIPVNENKHGFPIISCLIPIFMEKILIWNIADKAKNNLWMGKFTFSIYICGLNIKILYLITAHIMRKINFQK